MAETLFGVVGGGVIAAVVAYGIWLWFRVHGTTKVPNITLDSDSIYERMRNVEAQLSALMTTATPLSKLMRDTIIKELTHSHAPELDDLLAKVKADELLPSDEQRLFALLKERAEARDDRINMDERDAAIMLPPVMRRIKQERENPPVEIELRVVSVPVTEDK
jgi:hypothetical protein